MDKTKKTQGANASAPNPYVGFLIGIMIVLLLNGLLFPNIGKNRIVPTDYGTFVEKVESGKVKDVVIESNQIYFTVDEAGKTVAYKTGETNDPELVDRLLGAQSPNENNKINFNQVVPQENSPIMNFFLLWVRPCPKVHCL